MCYCLIFPSHNRSWLCDGGHARLNTCICWCCFAFGWGQSRQQMMIPPGDHGVADGALSGELCEVHIDRGMTEQLQCILCLPPCVHCHHCWHQWLYFHVKAIACTFNSTLIIMCTPFFYASFTCQLCRAGMNARRVMYLGDKLINCNK